LSAIDNSQASSLLNAILNQVPASSTAGINLRLGSNSPNASTTMVELPNGNGYTTGGTVCTFGSAAIVSGIPTSYNTSVLTWTNSSGGWTINGVELWDQAAIPLRWMWGTWIGAPISVASGNSFQVPASGIIASLQ
jgi:hypothetical protein